MNPQMGPRYILKDAYQIKLREVQYERHRKRLENIKSLDLHKEYNSEDHLEKLHQLKLNNLRFQNNEKLNQIDRENQILLERLVLISKSSNPELLPSKSEPKHGNILHLGYRKKEQGRITQENTEFARRLVSQRPLFDRKRMDKDYEKHNRLLKQMQKLDLYSPRHPSKLPPLQNEKLKDFDTSMSVETKYAKHYDSVILSPKYLVSPSSQGKQNFGALSPLNKNISFRVANQKSNKKPTEGASSSQKELANGNATDANETKPVKTEGDESTQGKVEDSQPQEKPQEPVNKPEEQVNKPEGQAVEVKQEKSQQIEENIPYEANQNETK